MTNLDPNPLTTAEIELFKRHAAEMPEPTDAFDLRLIETIEQERALLVAALEGRAAPHSYTYEAGHEDDLQHVTGCRACTPFDNIAVHLREAGVRLQRSAPKQGALSRESQTRVLFFQAIPFDGFGLRRADHPDVSEPSQDHVLWISRRDVELLLMDCRPKILAEPERDRRL